MRIFHDNFLKIKTDVALENTNTFGKKFTVHVAYRGRKGRPFELRTLDGIKLFCRSTWTRADAEFISNHANSYQPVQGSLALENAQ